MSRHWEDVDHTRGVGSKVGDPSILFGEGAGSKLSSKLNGCSGERLVRGRHLEIRCHVVAEVLVCGVKVEVGHSDGGRTVTRGEEQLWERRLRKQGSAAFSVECPEGQIVHAFGEIQKATRRPQQMLPSMGVLLEHFMHFGRSRGFM